MESDVSCSPSKRRKTQTPMQSPGSSKGKENMKVEEEEEEEDMNEVESEAKLCGICFEGNSIRGYIDSCDHFFCFVCIMEWSKVESRCPLCKQRFKNICRKPIGDVFPEERVVNVPVRNQVWHPLGNQTATEVADPYAEVKCIKCQTTSEDHLLLLCDLCDSAAHTFCVGLGHTVPEGDWYCEDCTKLRNEHSNSTVDTSVQHPRNFSTTTRSRSNAASRAPITPIEIDSDSEDSRSFITTPGASRNVPISEIVRGPYSRNGNRSQRRTSRNQDSSRVPGRFICSESTVDSSARTLSKSRIAHHRVRVYRENWDAIRNASLGFSSSLPKSGGKNGRKRARDPVVDKTRKPQPSSPMNHKQSNAEGDASGGRMDCNGPYDINRAWKMLDIAKSVQRGHEFTGSKQQGSKLHQGKCDVSTRLANTTGSGASMSTTQYLKPKDLVGGVLKKDGGHRSLEIAEEKLMSQTCEEGGYAWGSSYTQRRQGVHPVQHATQSSIVGKQDVSKATHRGSSSISPSGSKKFQSEYLGRNQLENNCIHHSFESAQQMDKYQLSQERKGASGTSCFQRPSSIYPSQSCGLSLVEPALKMNEVDPCWRIDSNEKIAPKWSIGRSSSVCTTSPSESLSRDSDLSYDRSNLCASSCSKEGRLKEVGSHRSSAKITVRKDEDAKGEVQSLVKLNLKLLGRDKRLGVDGFKEVARLATHTILAACGLEHKKASVHPFSDSICQHSDQTKKLHMSNLMPTSCRECFYSFVKDVVSSIMANKIAVSAASR